jgi:zinc/manganese transport system substrate-binding protein
LAAILALGAGGALAQQQQPLRVIASFSILGDMVKSVGGDAVAVTTLVGPNGDAHVYEPTPADAQAVASAQLVVVNGLGLEGWMTRLLQASGYGGPVVVASEGVTPRTMAEEDHEHAPAAGTAAAHEDHDHGHDHGAADPHAWQDLRNGQIYVRNIARGLAAAAPSHAAAFQAAGDRYGTELAALDAWVRSELSAIPPARRRIITSHDAFGYFGAAYGLEILAPVGISTESEATATNVAALIQQIRTTHVPAVFIENMTDPRLIEQIAREGGAVIGGELFSDALSPPDGPAPTYVAMFRHNVTSLRQALQGS